MTLTEGNLKTVIPHLFLISILILSFLTSPSLAASYGEGQLLTDMGAKSSFISGYSLFHISYYEGTSGIESELEFPLKAYLLGLEGAIIYRDRGSHDKFRLTFELLTNIDNGSGRLKDSDWLTDDIDIALYGVAHPNKDIYSESDIELDALVFDINMLYNIYNSQRLAIGPLLGYRHQDFRFIASNVNQIGYGPYSTDYTGFVPAEALHYEVRYDFFYGGISSEFSADSFKAGLMAGAGYVFAKDRDDHILRYKLAEAKTDGLGSFVNINASYFFTESLFLKAAGEYLKFHTTGTQHQYFYKATSECPGGGCDAYVSDRIDSGQWNFSLSMSYRFK
ncbi:MAG: omptin family outer membrane protease [Thermodesulfovibrionales bacterium]